MSNPPSRVFPKFTYNSIFSEDNAHIVKLNWPELILSTKTELEEGNLKLYPDAHAKHCFCCF